MLTSPANLAAIVQRFAHPRILLVGDIMIDEYIYGDAERLSPEAPVPVIQERYREQRAGGAGNVAAGLAALGAQVVVVSICGDDVQGSLLVDVFQKMGATTDGILRCTDRPTTSKTRLVGLAQHRHPQQMLRLDQESTRPLTAEQQATLLAYIKTQLLSVAAVALEDYNKGLLSPDFCSAVIQLARDAGKPILVDPAFIADYSKYTGVSVITPNRYEAERGSNLKLTTAEDAPRVAHALLTTLNLQACLLTLDKQGMYLLERPVTAPAESAATTIPTRPRNVYDVTGAGDMVLATLVMAIASGASWLDASMLANIAGGLEVEKFGIVPITKDEILDELHRQDADTRGKIRTLSALLKDLQHHRGGQGQSGGGAATNAGPKIVFTNGVFDVLHVGHVQYLAFSRRQGDLLIVGVNSDASVKRLKGPTRPLNNQDDRLAVLAALQAVDYVILFEEDTPAALIDAIIPNVLIKGDDYAHKEVVGRATVEKNGGQVILAPFLAGRSSTHTINQLQAKPT